MKTIQLATADFKGGHEPRNAGSLYWLEEPMKQIFPRASTKKHSAADTLVLTQWDFQIPERHDNEFVSF